VTITDALGSSLGALFGCVRNLAQRVDPLLDPLWRLFVKATQHAPSTPAPKAAQIRPGAGLQTQAAEAKYYLGPAPDVPRLDRESGELPRAYGQTRLVLLARDPWTVFAYWEVMPTSRVEVLRALGDEAEGAREVLRVYDVSFITFDGTNAWATSDLEPTPGTESWYVNVGRPATSFCAEIGLRTAGGRFVPLARSNTVTTPPSQPSADTTTRWVRLARGSSPLEVEKTGWSGPRVPTADNGELTGAPRSSDVHLSR